jgi:heme/copper-type cytochrome/quinol oxidase subunit 3
MHEQAPLAAHHVVAEDTTTGLNHRKMLMWLFLGSDCLFFAALISTYLIYRGQSLVGPFPEDVFSIPVTSVSTFALLMSSMSMVLAYSAINRGDMKAFRIWLLSTCMLGATFLGFQVFEFYDFSEHGLTPRTNLFGTTFFVLTGFHGAHVTIGVIWLLSIFGYSLIGGKKAERILTDREALSVDLAALYWHFVDIVWIVIFAVVYLIGIGVT